MVAFLPDSCSSGSMHSFINVADDNVNAHLSSSASMNGVKYVVNPVDVNSDISI